MALGLFNENLNAGLSYSVNPAGDGADTSSTKVPSWAVAVRAHSIAGDKPENVSIADAAFDLVTKAVPLSIGSGVSQLYNIVPSLGNFFGGDFEQFNYKKAVQDYDNDLGKYYEDHQQGIDTLGFIASSLVPGMAGVKMLNKGQAMLSQAMSSGNFGANIGKSLGLLPSTRTANITKAIEHFTTTGNPYAITQSNTLKALAAGVGQNALEGAAFTTLVNATMFDSPVLADRDIGDLTMDVATGAVLGGVVGGLISGVTAVSAIKKGVALGETKIAQFGVTEAARPNFTESDRILHSLNQIDNLPKTSELDDGLAARASDVANTTKSRLLTGIRQDMHKLTGEDREVGQILFDQLKLKDSKIAKESFLDAKAISRPTSQSAVERQLADIKSKLNKSGDDLSALTPEEVNTYLNSNVSYVKIKGEGFGTVTDERPLMLTLGDHLKAGQQLALHPKGIMVGDELFPQVNNPYKPFNILGETTKTVRARYAWANLLPKWVDDPVNIQSIHATDIPLLQKAVKDGISDIKIIPESGLIEDVYQLSGKDSIREFTKRQKVSLAFRMQQAQTVPLNEQEFLAKAGGLLGINFNIVNRMARGTFAQIPGVMKGQVITGDAVNLSQSSIRRKSLMTNLTELKRLEGHAVFQSLVSAHGITGKNFQQILNTPDSKLMQEVLDLSKSRFPAMWKSTKPEMIKRREDTAELFANAFAYLSKNPAHLAKMPEFNQFAGHLVRPIPQEILDSVTTRATKISVVEAAARVDVEEQLLRAAAVTEDGYFATDKAFKQYMDHANKAGTRPSELLSNFDALPSFVKIVSNSSRFAGLNPMDVSIHAALASKAKLYDEAVTANATRILGEELPNISDDVLLAGGDTGASMLTATSGQYGTRDAWSSYIGQRTNALINKSKTSVSDQMTPLLHKLANDTDAAIEFSLLNETMRSKTSGYRFERANPQEGMYGKLVLKASDGSELDSVPIKSLKVADLVEAHIAANGRRVNQHASIHALEGRVSNIDPQSYYPIPRNLKNTPHFNLVVDDSVTGTGHTSLIYAADDKSLKTMREHIQQSFPEFKVLSKAETEAYYKSVGKFDYEQTLSENYINNALTRKGISSSILPVTDPQKIVTDFLDWHLQRESSLIRSAVSHRYSRQMEILTAQAAPDLEAAKSVFGYMSPERLASHNINNPALNTIKQMLNIQKMDEYPYWTTFNRTLDEKFSSIYKKVDDLWNSATHPDHLLQVNKALEEHGYRGPIVTDALYAAMNSEVPRGTLVSLVSKMNAVLGSIALRSDPMHALTNSIGHSVLFGTEAKAVINAITKGSKEGAAELADLAHVKVPGTEDYIFSPAKVIAKSLSNERRLNPELRQFYKDKGFILSEMDKYDQTLDHIAIKARDTANAIEGRLSDIVSGAKKLGDTAEKLSQNKLSEEFNRYLSADFMKQITDIAVKHGLMDEVSALPYINTFVNRTNGNYLASQRPILFQGAIGQAIGLFQTYQFTLLQQVFRHVGDKNTQNAFTMLGLQSGIFGLNGLPAFNAINTYLVGMAGGNREHADLYQSIFNGAGKEAGEWLAYGALSNMFSLIHPDLKTNLYTRGDINPRSLTIVPTDPSKIPIFQATASFFSNIKDMINQQAIGADMWPTFLRGLEHNSVSRPLAGLAQVLGGLSNESGKVISTNRQGNILMAHDLWSLTSLARLAGAKPLDESMVQDAMYRINAYRAYDAAKRSSLGEAIKTNILSSGTVDEDEIENYMNTYVRYGGKQEEFNRFMTRQYKNASVSQAEQLRSKLGSTHGMYLQQLMEGQVD